MLKDVDKLDNMLQGVANHVATVAASYAAAINKYGQPFEDALVDRGYERDWLKVVYEIGEGNAHPKMAFVAPEKRSVLMNLPASDQKKVMDTGVNGRPLEKVSVDELRAAVLNVVDRKPLADRKTKERPPRKRWTSDEHGVRLVISNVPWEEMLKIISHGVSMGYLTVSQMEHLREEIGERLGEKQLA